MKRMKLRTKLTWGFSLCVLVIIALGGYTIMQVDRMAAIQSKAAQRSKDAQRAGVASFIGFRSHSVIACTIIHTDFDESVQEWNEVKQKNEQLLKEVESSVDTDKEQEWLEKARDEYQQMIVRFEKDLLPVLKNNGDPAKVNALESEIERQKSVIYENLRAISNSMSKEAEDANNDFTRLKSWIISISLILCGMGVLGAIIIAVVTTRSITAPIKRVSEGVFESVEQVAAASGQLSSSSQQLAEGASEQAASIEETSSSLEEMASMTRQNADNATHANTIMTEARQVVSQANDSMSQLISSMDDISKASEETQKIIKTIDEIAFQTNLLALNAAVEAARAGDAGAGFAVVADEVRNLAMRAAEAAKNTANLIEGTVKKIKDGSELVETTSGQFSKVTDSAWKIGELVAEIAAASQEQAQGIEQVNKAVSEMDKIVQRNAANAEESASAAEEMSAQSEQVKRFADDLVVLVSGSSRVMKSPQGPMQRKQIVGAPVVSEGRAFSQAEKGSRVEEDKSLTVQPRRKGEIDPEELIPFDDEDSELF